MPRELSHLGLFTFLTAHRGRSVAAGAILLVLVSIILYLAAQPEQREVWVPIRPVVEMTYVPGHDQGPGLSAAAAVLMEPTTRSILYARNEHDRRSPASTTKIMTGLLVLEEGRLDDMVTVSRYAASIGGSSLQLRRGQEISLWDLLHGLLIRSGNDAAVAVAEHVAGSETDFVRRMNARARELGARNTLFQNPHGLDRAGHYSTAFDLAHMARLALLYPTFAEIVAMREYHYEERDRTWRNTNQLLWGFEGCEGVKTGTTSGAGNCLVAAATRQEMQLISVVLGSRNRWQDASRLMDYGFDEFHLLTLARQGQSLAEVDVPGAMEPLQIVAGRDFRFVVRSADVNTMGIHMALDDLHLPIRRGDAVGELHVFVDPTGAEDSIASSEPTYRVQLVADATVLRWTPLRGLWRWLQGLLSP